MWAIVASSLVLATIACTEPRLAAGSEAPPPAATTASPDTASASSRSVTQGTLQVGKVIDAPALGRGTRGIQILGPSTYWIADDRTAPEHSVIVGWDPPAAPRILFSPIREGAHFQLLNLSADWMTWMEHVESRTWKDGRIYAARIGSAQRILIDDMSTYGDLVTYPEMALDGSDLYWTVPEIVNGEWHGLIKHQDLAVGKVETLDTGNRAVFSWPSARHGVVAYEVAAAGHPYAVRYQRGGRTTEITGTVSEPTVGEGFLLLKIGDRYENGAVGIARFGDAKVMELGKGEAPRADGVLAVWQNAGSLGGVVARPAETCVAPFLNSRMVDNSSEFGLAIGGTRLGWVYSTQQGSAISESVRTATIEHFSC
jgi:hypothetical protein